MLIQIISCLLSSLVFQLSVAQNGNLMVKLTDIDSTYVMNGNLVKNFKNIVVDAGDLDNLIYVIPYFNNQDATNFFLFDDSNVPVISKALIPLQTFQAHLTIDFTNNINFDFALVFKRFLRADESKTTSFDFETIPLKILDAGEDIPLFTFTAQNKPLITTVFGPLDRTYQWVLLNPQFITENCSISLFAGGHPSDLGLEKYRLYDFDAKMLTSFADGVISTFGFTFLIPAGCQLSAYMNANPPPPDTRLDFALHKGEEGFVMSNGYMQVDGLQQNKPFIFDLSLFDEDWDQNVTKFFLEVVNFNSGDQDGSSFFINFGNDDGEIMIEKSTSNATYSSHTVMAELRFDAMTDHSSVFVRYKTLPDGTYVATTTPKLSNNAGISCISLLLILFSIKL